MVRMGVVQSAKTLMFESDSRTGAVIEKPQLG